VLEAIPAVIERGSVFSAEHAPSNAVTERVGRRVVVVAAPTVYVLFDAREKAEQPASEPGGRPPKDDLDFFPSVAENR